MNTTKTKRWNGTIDTLTADFLKSVLEQMLSYGDRVQFALNRGGQRPHYQVINTSDKKMTFEGNHLLTSNADDFVGSSTTSRIYTLEQIEGAMNGVSTKTAKTGVVRASGGGSTGLPRTTAAQKIALLDAEKYAYFKEHRATLPADIGKHAQEISALMMNGLSAEDAFADVIKRHH